MGMNCANREDILQIIELHDYVNVVRHYGWDEAIHIIHGTHPFFLVQSIITELKKCISK